MKWVMTMANDWALELEKLNALIRKARALGMDVRLAGWKTEKSHTAETRKLRWNLNDERRWEYVEVPDDAPCTISIGQHFRHIYKGDIEDYTIAKSMIRGAAENIGRLSSNG